VEVDLVDGDAVDLALGVGDQPVDGEGILFDGVRDVQMFDAVGDVLVGVVGVFAMVVVVIVFLCMIMVMMVVMVVRVAVMIMIVVVMVAVAVIMMMVM